MADTNETYKTNFADKSSSYEAALTSLFTGKPEETEADLAKLFTPTFTLRADEGTFDFNGFVKHIRWLRKDHPPKDPNNVLTVVQFLRDGFQLAGRHTSKGWAPDKPGSESFMFAEVAEDGRIKWIVETVRKY